MQINPYLTFGGQCAEAFRFYAQTLGGTLEVQTHGESPMAGQVPESWNDLVLHARLVVGDEILMGSDRPPDDTAAMQGFSVSVSVDDPTEADRIFAALAEGGNVTMPIAESFWAARFGMLVDRFGTPWMVNCDKPA
jgi:PhnB protein